MDEPHDGRSPTYTRCPWVSNSLQLGYSTYIWKLYFIAACIDDLDYYTILNWKLVLEAGKALYFSWKEWTHPPSPSSYHHRHRNHIWFKKYFLNIYNLSSTAAKMVTQKGIRHCPWPCPSSGRRNMQINKSWRYELYPNCNTINIWHSLFCVEFRGRGQWEVQTAQRRVPMYQVLKDEAGLSRQIGQEQGILSRGNN